MEIWLFVIRLGVLLSLYLFLAAALRLIWRELAGVAESASSSEPAYRSRLLVIETGETNLTVGESLPITGRISVGRALGNSLVLVDSSISAHHALLSYREGHWWLEDRNSTNGTTVNGTRIHDEVPLRNQDIIALGQIRLRLVLADSDQ